MDKEIKKKYAEVLLNAYQNGIMKIVWSTSGFSIVVDSKKRKTIPELNQEEFIEYVFSIIKTVADLAEQGEEVSVKDEADLKIAKAILEKEDDLKNHLYIKKHSNMECFKLLNYEIISHRNEDNPIKIEANSAILKISSDMDEKENVHLFEISRRDLKEILDKLYELKEKMETIEGDE